MTWFITWSICFVSWFITCGSLVYTVPFYVHHPIYALRLFAHHFIYPLRLLFYHLLAAFTFISLGHWLSSRKRTSINWPDRYQVLTLAPFVPEYGRKKSENPLWFSLECHWRPWPLLDSQSDTKGKGSAEKVFRGDSGGRHQMTNSILYSDGSISPTDKTLG